jgi:endonuclease-3
VGRGTKATGDKAAKVLGELKKLYPGPRHYLRFDDPFQLLVATILSAQCPDDKVNEVTGPLFKRYRSPRDFAEEDIEKLEEAVRPTGFYRNKAKAVKGAAQAIVERFGGKVPGTMEELVSLPGIARKSANAILQHGFDSVVGVVVDTHVIRVAGRLGWTKQKDPVKIERDLMELFPESEWKWIPFYMKNHGRAVCRAPVPKCTECAISSLCPSAGTITSKKRKKKSPKKRT